MYVVADFSLQILNKLFRLCYLNKHDIFETISGKTRTTSTHIGSNNALRKHPRKSRLSWFAWWIHEIVSDFCVTGFD